MNKRMIDMQTFLPYPNFRRSAACLDNRRLGKQRVECKQIYLALTELEYGWKNHPAVRMWSGHEGIVAYYGFVCCRVWCDRGFNDSMMPWFRKRSDLSMDLPSWFGDWVFHRSHQSNLVRKMPEHYRIYFPFVPDDLSYVWPLIFDVEKEDDDRKLGRAKAHR